MPTSGHRACAGTANVEQAVIMGGMQGPGEPGSDAAPARVSQALAPASPSDDPARGAQTTVPVVIVERTLDGAVVALSMWTVVYHLCLVLRWDVRAALLLMLLGTGLMVGWWTHRRGGSRVTRCPAAEPPREQ